MYRPVKTLQTIIDRVNFTQRKVAFLTSKILDALFNIYVTAKTDQRLLTCVRGDL